MLDTVTTKPSYVVSPNFYDRRGPQRWLSRPANLEPEKATTASEIYAENVTFVPSSDYERGFGCGTVAEAEFMSESVPDDIKDFVKLRFVINNFYVGEVSTPIKSVERLVLAEDGGVYANGITFGYMN